MKEHSSQIYHESTLPPLRHGSISKLTQQHKVDSLLKQINTTSRLSTNIKAALVDKNKGTGQSKSKTLLRSINGINRMGLKGKSEGAENGGVKRLETLKGQGGEKAKINLTSVGFMAPTVQTDSIRVSAQVIESDLPHFSPQNQPQSSLVTLQSDLNQFLSQHLIAGVTLKQI